MLVEPITHVHALYLAASVLQHWNRSHRSLDAVSSRRAVVLRTGYIGAHVTIKNADESGISSRLLRRSASYGLLTKAGAAHCQCDLTRDPDKHKLILAQYGNTRVRPFPTRLSLMFEKS